MDHFEDHSTNGPKVTYVCFEPSGQILMKLHRGLLNRISFIINLDPAAVTGCELDVAFLCDKATVAGEDVTDVLCYMSTAMQNLSQTCIT